MAPLDLTRRELIEAAGLAAAWTVLPSEAAFGQAAAAALLHAGVTLPLTLTVNGAPRTMMVEPDLTLLDALRDRLGLTGTKVGCAHGACGACTVHVNGRRVLSCLTLAVSVGDLPITTIEGLADGDTLHPVQAAFIEHDAYQCGYCTPGQIMSAVGCIREGHTGSDAEIREWMSGNLCRCGAYPNIVAAVKDAAVQTARG